MPLPRVFLLLILLQNVLPFAQPLSRHPLSTEAEIGNEPCRDTIKILRRTEFYDIGVVLPSWQPIVNESYVAVLEGTVSFHPKHGGNGPHISHEDYPLYHYTHDFNFNVIPDKTPDNRFTNLCPLLVYNHKGTFDTALRNNVHVEWETGVANYNRVNPFKHTMDRGNSAGFFSAGHQRTETFWNFPAINDWVHVEGHYVWDRGHPPAKAEIHPPRFVAVKRQLPEKIAPPNDSFKFATRIDVFASGDGGAFNNNRTDVPAWVQPVRMSSKDYSFSVVHNLPRPSATAKLKVIDIERNAHSFSSKELMEINDSAGSVHFFIPWKEKQAPDTAIFAKSYFVYWDEGNGVSTFFKIHSLDVKLRDLQFKKLSEVTGKAELRMFANVGSNWILLNDFFPSKGKVLSRGMGKTNKRNWQLDLSFTLHVPDASFFRVYAAGWEADGVDRWMGDIADQCMPCTPKTKRYFKKKMLNFATAWGGCLDDQIGEATKLHSPKDLLEFNYFKSSPFEGRNEDPCPFSKYELKDRYILTYTIERKTETTEPESD